MEKIKKFLIENKIFVIVFVIGITVLVAEFCLLNKESNPKQKKKNTVNSSSNLSRKQKEVLGLVSNSNEGSHDKIDYIKEEKKNLKEEESKTDTYKEYEKLSDKEKEKLEVIPNKNKVYIDSIDDLKDNDSYKNENALPRKYNLDEIITLNYEDQNPYGLCWDFASLKSIESYLQLNKLGTYNFSELAIDYITSDKMYGTREIHQGGSFGIVVESSLFNNGIIETKDMPNDNYEYDYEKEEYDKFIDLAKRNIYVTDYVVFPTIIKDEGKYLASGEEIDDSKIDEIKTLIKNHIMTNGSLYMVHNGDLFMGHDSFYCENDCGPSNHALSIIGWDDDYPKDKLVKLKYDYDTMVVSEEKEHPKNNGAWIIANSWSTEKKFYYVSYEDGKIYSEIAGVKSTNFDTSLNLSKITNPKLRNYLKNKYITSVVTDNGFEYIPRSTTRYVNTLNLVNLDITNDDLKILEYFDNLGVLNLTNNDITSLDNLPVLTNLYYLTLNDNKITDISKLGQLESLELLDANNNNITDVSVLKNSKISSLSLSENKNITGYEELFKNVSDDEYITFNLSNCNITNFSTSKKIDLLDLSSNPNLSINGKLDVTTLYLNNNNITNLDILNNVDKDSLIELHLSKNDIKDVEPLTNFNSIRSIDLSFNKNIENISILKNIYKEETDSKEEKNELSFSTSIKKIFDEEDTQEDMEEEFDYYGEFEVGGDGSPFSLILDDTNISDITLLNEFFITGDLSLKNNNIKTIKDYKFGTIGSIDLSGNKFEDDSYKELFVQGISNIFLSNCGLSDISVLENLENKKEVFVLDLSSNEIKDISPLSGYDIFTLSIADNKGITGKLPVKGEFKSLNISGCDVKNDTFDIEDLKAFEIINFSYNPEFSEFDKILFDGTKLNTLYSYGDNYILNINTNQYNLYGDIYVNYNSNNGVINIGENSNFYEILLSNIIHYNNLDSIENCTIDKYLKNITVTGNTSCSFKFKSPYFDDYTKFIIKTN